MAPRSSWKGYLKLSLINVAVKAYTASSSSSGSIRLNQLHKECNSRIKYQKICPIHGEVRNDEIVSGYEYAKGQYVVVDPDEIDQLRRESDKAISVDAFIEANSLDPLYHSGRMYYLVPSDPVSQKPYALIRDAMDQMSVQAVAKVILSGKEQLVLLRPCDGLVAMQILNYDATVKQPDAFKDEIDDLDTGDDELSLAKTLIENLMQSEFDISAYEDEYTIKLRQLIEAKVEGRELVTPPEADQPQVINLMDALRMSVEQAAGEIKMAPTSKPAKTKKKTSRRKTSRKKKMEPSTTKSRKKSSTGGKDKKTG